MSQALEPDPGPPPPPTPVRRIAIRQLQRRAALVIKELTEAEEAAEITSRGRVIARLIPVSPMERTFLDLIERGEIAPGGVQGGDLADIEPLPPRPDGRSLCDELAAMREEEPW
ncbi:MAG: hypothetical protein ACRDPY_03565 [Streptosporangiaceae bacterium]